MKLRLGLLFCLLPAFAEDAWAERAGAGGGSLGRERLPLLRLSARAGPWRKEAAWRDVSFQLVEFLEQLGTSGILQQWSIPAPCKESIKRIKNLNSFSSSNNITAVYGINQFSHLFPEEFQAIYLQSRPSTVPKYTPRQEGTEIPLPARFDWRDKKVVTQVRNQGTCGSCWAFSIVGALESVYAIKGNVLEELSVQQVIDCSYNNWGCHGGSTVSALSWLNQHVGHWITCSARTLTPWIGLAHRGFYDSETQFHYCKTAFGSGHCQCAAACVSIDQRSPMTAMEAFSRTQVKLVRDSEYTYKAGKGQCHYFDRSHFGVSVTGYAASNFRELEDEMMKWLLKWGPLSIIVNAISWQDYLGGIIQHHCSSGKGNHAVLITGFDKTGSIPYWIVKNSWGPLWGRDGYVYIKMGSNICGIADTVSAVFA